jgi:hypothetical protein
MAVVLFGGGAGQERLSPRSPGGGGGGGLFLGGLTQNSHPSSANIKNVWRFTSTPPTLFRGLYMDYEGGDRREQDTEQLNLPSVELESFFHCYRDKQMRHGGSGQQTGGSRVVWRLCGPGW